MESLEQRVLLSASSFTELTPASRAMVLLPNLGGSPKGSGTTTITDDIGNTITAAKALSLDSLGSASLSAKIDYTGDVDVIRFTSTVSGTLTARLTPVVARKNNVSGDLAALDAAGVQLVRDTDGTNTQAAVTLDVVAGTTYYLRAAALSGTGGYSVAIATVAAPTPPAPDPDPLPPPPPPADTHAPGTVVSWHTDTTSTGNALVVLGTDSADSITVSRSGASTLLWVSGQKYVLGDTFVSVTVYGFGGDDLIVTVSGAGETVYGGTGFDVFWGDTQDSLADTEAAETAAKSVHLVSQFLQPTTDPTKAVTLELAGQDLVDPSGSSTWANFSGYKVFSDGPEYNDVIQGGVGDCYLMAALSSLAQSDPMVVRQMITPLGDGTFAVRFYRSGQEVYVRVDGQLPVASGTQLSFARLSLDGETWVALVEKAYAQFRTGANSYASLASGWTSTVYQEVTNGLTSTMMMSGYTADTLVQYLQTNLAAGHAVTVGSISPTLDPAIVGSHAYQVISLQNTSGQWTVTVYNPWGRDGSVTPTDSNYSDGLVTISLTTFQQNFYAIGVSLV